MSYQTLCLIFFATFLEVACSKTCNGTEQWKCPNDDQCIPNAYRCDNVPDCPTNGSDEKLNCPKPGSISGFKVQVYAHNLKSNDFKWTSLGDKVTNVTVVVTYIDGETNQNESIELYAWKNKCYDFRPDMCKEQYLCTVIPMTKAFCKKKCGACRIDTARDQTRLDLMPILRMKATNIEAVAYASNYNGDGPTTDSITVPMPEITSVKDLAINITHKWVDNVWATLSWKRSKFIQKPNLYSNDNDIKHVIRRCLVDVNGTGGEMLKECEDDRPLFEKKAMEKFDDLRYDSKYSFTVTPVYRYADEISGTPSTVYLTTPAKQKGFQLNVVALICGLVGAIILIVIIVVVYRRCHCGGGSEDKYNAAVYSTAPDSP